MSDPKLHHYVPQFHLRRFADEKGQLWVWDRNLDKVFRTKPGNVAAESQFYRLPHLAEHGHDPLAMERQLADLEGQVARITDQWLYWLYEIAPMETVDVPQINRELVALHIALQFLRTTDTREILAIFAEADEGTEPLSVDDKRRLHAELLWDSGAAQALAERIQQSIWIFGRNDSETPFVTSDNPVTFRTGDNRQWVRGGVHAPGTHVVYPLNPDIVMYCYPRGAPCDKLKKLDLCLSPVTFTDEMVDGENSGQIFMASRFIFSSENQFEAARKFAKTIGTDIHRPDHPEGESG